MIIDSHCHLHDAVYRDFHDIMGRAVAHNVWGVVAVGCDPDSNLKTLELANRYSKVVWPALGLHPERIQPSDEALSRVEQQIVEHHARLVAVGEVGLPWYCLEGAGDVATVKHEALGRLEKLARLAKRFDLPMVLHAPHGAAVEALALLRRVGVDRAVFHWHKAPLEVTEEIIRSGYFISVTPEVAYRERDQELVRRVPVESLLVETDGPWKFGGEFSGQVTEPWMASRVVETIAKLKGLHPDDAAIQISANTCDCFELT